MTAIAYRDGIMAADSAAWSADHVKIPCRPKIRRLPSGAIYASCGETSEVERFAEWMHGCDRPVFDKEDNFTALMASADGLLCYTWKLQPYKIMAPFFCVGMPVEFMLGALYAGASAEEAVRLAILHTDGAGGEVQVERL